MEHTIYRRKLLGLLSFIFIGACCYTLLLQSLLSLPSLYRINVGDQINLGVTIPRQITASITESITPGNSDTKSPKEQHITVLSRVMEPGRFHMDLRLFGLLPLKRVDLQVVFPAKVIVGGQSIGVLLHSQGVIVVGYARISQGGGEESPARQAGIRTGDRVLKIEDTVVQSDAQVSYLIDRYARTNKVLRFSVKHQGKLKLYLIKPVYCKETRRYRVGLFIRDGAAGVGTLTFFDPVTRKYGALGHMITNSDTNETLDLKDGKIVGATVQGIVKGGRGKIGEKVGLLCSNQKTTGSITKNTKYGIFGRLDGNLNNACYPRPLPVALSTQIREGSAEILTVLSGDKLESFKVEIERIFSQSQADGKSFVIRITDQRLLAKTGGIIQGMSGSPIIQQERLVGAVTHVFLNNPVMGYGIAADLMMEEVGLLGSKNSSKATELPVVDKEKI